MKQKLLYLSISLLFVCSQMTTAQTADHVVISEVYGGGGNSGGKFKNDFIELYNPTESAISLAGWSVQYAAAAPNNPATTPWAVTPLTGSIPPRSFYLIQQAIGAAITQPALPTPDDVGTITMSGTTGKVALCNGTTALIGNAPAISSIIDLVGWGPTANYAEGTPAPVTTNATSIERKAVTDSDAASLASGGRDAVLGNGWDANNNSLDFVAQSAVYPQNSLAKEPTKGIFPSVTTLKFDNQYVGVTSIPKLIKVNYSELTSDEVNFVTAAPFSLSKTAQGTYGNSLTFTDAELSALSSLSIYVTVNLPATGPATGTLTFSGGGLTTGGQATLTANGVTPIATKLISAIQGNGSNAAEGEVTVEAIVTGVYGTLDPPGFYIQEEDADNDGDVDTSEGIFVVQTDPAVSIGDKVLITGGVLESNVNFSFNQAVITSPAVSIISSGALLPSFVMLSNADYNPAAMEKYEGMRVQFSDDLKVSDNYSLGMYGELSLSTSGTLYTATQIVDPNDDPASGFTNAGSNIPAVVAYAAANVDKVIILDDGSGLSNPTPIPYLDPALKSLRLNSTISNLRGIMGYGFNRYRIQPLPGADAPIFVAAARPSVPTFTNATLKLASFNVLNYFNGTGVGQNGFPTSRGALTYAAFQIQRSKIIKALAQMNADVVGLIEIENDGVGSTSAIQDLINGLNAELGTPNAYTFVNDGASSQTGNTDAIRCAIIYKSASFLSPLGTAQLDGVAEQRPFLAQTFTTTAGEKFTFIVNHFKSKGSGGTGTDANQGDGQGFYNAMRQRQANALINFISTLVTTSGSDRIVSVGDYNAYYEEDPMDLLRAAGLTVGSKATDHSYLFEGAIGSLDHAVFSSSMNTYAAVKKWNINSDEPTVLQYINAAADATIPYRSSDHDPLVIGVNFSGALPVSLVSFTAKPEGEKVKLNWSTTSETNNSFFTIQRSGNGKQFVDIANIDGGGNSSKFKAYSHTDSLPLEGTSYYRLKQTDYDGTSSLSRIVPVKFTAGENMEFSVFPNPVTDHLNLKLSGLKNEGKVLNYEIISDSGKKLYSGKGTLTEINKAADQLLPRIQTGLYILRAFDNSNSYVFKFMKQ